MLQKNKNSTHLPIYWSNRPLILLVDSKNIQTNPLSSFKNYTIVNYFSFF